MLYSVCNVIYIKLNFVWKFTCFEFKKVIKIANSFEQIKCLVGTLKKKKKRISYSMKFELYTITNYYNNNAEYINERLFED